LSDWDPNFDPDQDSDSGFDPDPHSDPGQDSDRDPDLDPTGSTPYSHPPLQQETPYLEITGYVTLL
jgi:hypothetical protein